VTLGFVVETVGIRVSSDSLVFEGTEYSEAEGYEVEIRGTAVVFASVIQTHSTPGRSDRTWLSLLEALSR
jgi:hypothetical protein